VRISVLNSAKLQATIRAVSSFDRTVQATIRKVTNLIGQPEWQKAVMGNTSTAFERRVLGQTARMTVSNQNVMLKAGHIGRPLRGGGRPTELYGPAEFGGRAKQFRPPNRRGYVVYPAAARMIARFAALWTQTVVRAAYEAFEGRNSG